MFRHFPVAMLIAASLATAPAMAADFRIATQQEAVAILTAEDEVLSRFQPLEIGVRLESETDQSLQSLQALYADVVTEFTDAERAQLDAVVVAQAERIASIAALLPEEILFIATDRRIDGGFPHTRANAIVFPGGVAHLDDAALTALFWHELYHVLSRHIADERDEMYALLGYRPCDFQPGEELHARRLTNPDAPGNDHYAPLELENADGVVPYLNVPEGGYSAERGGSFPNYFGFALVAVSVDDGVCTPVTGEDGAPVMLNPGTAPGFLDLIGRNTQYVIHPEETLADNFTLWMTGAENLPNPEIVERVRDWHLALATERAG
ncbi:hypothetical protein [Hyphobacterium marinum]|uniref:DUF4157 domain-containing protein n=1 Tax=Hyphobacterium marinum TaxID=3116574 RepID=A0ABU7M0A5_9PROT|nr:hypothetical protein [Hyphobacterium sp. Y6023]MEE2567252.1 hypothetical protein [Hyphobacterium sp. Y6023]